MVQAKIIRDPDLASQCNQLAASFLSDETMEGGLEGLSGKGGGVSGGGMGMGMRRSASALDVPSYAVRREATNTFIEVGGGGHDEAWENSAGGGQAGVVEGGRQSAMSHDTVGTLRDPDVMRSAAFENGETGKIRPKSMPLKLDSSGRHIVQQGGNGGNSGDGSGVNGGGGGGGGGGTAGQHDAQRMARSHVDARHDAGGFGQKARADQDYRNEVERRAAQEGRGAGRRRVSQDDSSVGLKSAGSRSSRSGRGSFAGDMLPSPANPWDLLDSTMRDTNEVLGLAVSYTEHTLNTHDNRGRVRRELMHNKNININTFDAEVRYLPKEQIEERMAMRTPISVPPSPDSRMNYMNMWSDYTSKVLCHVCDYLEDEFVGSDLDDDITGSFDDDDDHDSPPSAQARLRAAKARGDRGLAGGSRGGSGGGDEGGDGGGGRDSLAGAGTPVTGGGVGGGGGGGGEGGEGGEGGGGGGAGETERDLANKLAQALRRRAGSTGESVEGTEVSYGTRAWMSTSSFQGDSHDGMSQVGDPNDANDVRQLLGAVDEAAAEQIKRAFALKQVEKQAEKINNTNAASFWDEVETPPVDKHYSERAGSQDREEQVRRVTPQDIKHDVTPASEAASEVAEEEGGMAEVAEAEVAAVQQHHRQQHQAVSPTRSDTTPRTSTEGVEVQARGSRSASELAQGLPNDLMGDMNDSHASSHSSSAPRAIHGGAMVQSKVQPGGQPGGGQPVGGGDGEAINLLSKSHSTRWELEQVDRGAEMAEERLYREGGMVMLSAKATRGALECSALGLADGWEDRANASVMELAGHITEAGDPVGSAWQIKETDGDVLFLTRQPRACDPPTSRLWMGRCVVPLPAELVYAWIRDLNNRRKFDRLCKSIDIVEGSASASDPASLYGTKGSSSSSGTGSGPNSAANSYSSTAGADMMAAGGGGLTRETSEEFKPTVTPASTPHGGPPPLGPNGGPTGRGERNGRNMRRNQDLCVWHGKFKTKRCFKTFARDLVVLQYCAPVQMEERRRIPSGDRDGGAGGMAGSLPRGGMGGMGGGRGAGWKRGRRTPQGSPGRSGGADALAGDAWDASAQERSLLNEKRKVENALRVMRGQHPLGPITAGGGGDGRRRRAGGGQ